MAHINIITDNIDVRHAVEAAGIYQRASSMSALYRSARNGLTQVIEAVHNIDDKLDLWPVARNADGTVLHCDPFHDQAEMLNQAIDYCDKLAAVALHRIVSAHRPDDTNTIVELDLDAPPLGDADVVEVNTEEVMNILRELLS